MPIQQKLPPPVLLFNDFAGWEHCTNVAIKPFQRYALLWKWIKISKFGMIVQHLKTKITYRYNVLYHELWQGIVQT